jgi:hypothetical protein
VYQMMYLMLPYFEADEQEQIALMSQDYLN